MRLAFLISAYDDPQQLRRLTESLPATADCFVHVDANTDIGPFTALMSDPRVRFIPNRVRTAWGDFSQVEYQMRLLRAALDTGNDYDYLFVLSAMDYPVWSNRRIEDYLAGLRGRSLLKAICMEGQRPAVVREYTRYRLLNGKCWPPGSLRSKARVALRRLVALVARKPLTFRADGREYRLYKGSDYFAVTARLARFIIEAWDGRPQLRAYFRTSFAPSETFVHTLVFNSEHAGSCLLAEGDYRSLAELTPLTYIHYDPIVKVLTEEDYASILASGRMFCRKIRTGTSDRLVERLDRERACPKPCSGDSHDAPSGGAS